MTCDCQKIARFSCFFVEKNKKNPFLDDYNVKLELFCKVNSK